MDPYSDRASAATYADALFGTAGYPDAAGDVLTWVMETMAAPLGDPAGLGRKPVVVLCGDHHQLVRDLVWGRDLLPFDQFYETVPTWDIGPYRWSVADDVHSYAANDLVEVRIVPPGGVRHETLDTRHVDWSTCGPLYQDLYDHYRRAGASPADARTFAAATVGPRGHSSPSGDSAAFDRGSPPASSRTTQGPEGTYWSARSGSSMAARPTS